MTPLGLSNVDIVNIAPAMRMTHADPTIFIRDYDGSKGSEGSDQCSSETVTDFARLRG